MVYVHSVTNPQSFLKWTQDKLCTVHYFQIRIQDVVELTEKDFEKLGVTAIGLQLRLKQACRNHLQGN